MKQLAQRTIFLGMLGGFAVLWTFLMGLGVTPADTADGTAAGFSQAAAAVSGTGAQITYVDESRFPDVTVFLVANDQAGQPVLNLRKENFALTEDGTAVPLTNFTTAGNQAATVVLVIDGSGSMNDEAKLAGAQQAAVSFVEHLQPGQDQVGLIVFSSGSEIVAPFAPLTAANKQTLIDQIQRLSTMGGTQFYQAVQDAIAQFHAAAGRKVVLALTDGRDDNGQALLASTIAAAKQANVAIYTVGLGSDVDEDGLRQLATANGGTYAFSPSADQLEQLYLDIAGSLRNEYALTYQSATPNLDGTRRNLQVLLTTAGGEQIQAGSVYGVAGVLATSLNPVLFFPLLIGLLIGLLALYQLPQWRRRASLPLAEALPPGAPVAQSPHVAPLATGGAGIATPAAQTAPSRVAEAAIAHSVAVASPPLAPRVQPGADNPLLNTSSPTLIQQFPLTTPETLIGSAAGCHIVVAHPSIKPQHARITLAGNRYILDDLSGGQTRVSFTGDPAQLRAVQRNALRDDSLLQMGEIQLQCRHLTTQSPRLERRHPLPGTGATLGADASCELIIPGAAPRQARVWQEGQRWVVEDLAGSGAFISYNGNPAQERPVVGRNALKAGSTLRIGTTTVRVEV